MAKINFNPFEFFKNLFKENRVVFEGSPVPGAAPEPAPGTPGAAPEAQEAEIAKQRRELDKKQRELEREKLKAEAKAKGISVRELEKLKREEKLADVGRDQQKLQRVDRTRLFEQGKSMNLSPELFEFHSKEKLDKLYDTLLATGAFGKADLDWMRHQLSYCYEHEFENDARRRMYQFPAEGNSLDLITSDEIVDGRGGQMFVLALTYFQSVKQILLEQQTSYLNWDAAQREKKHEPLTTKLVDKVEEIGSGFVTAFEERDYSKLALYGAAAWALIAVYKQLGKSSDSLMVSVKKYLPWAVGIYAVTAIAAPDTFKKIWGKGIDADLKGTAFENLAQMQRYSPEPYLKAIDVSLAATLGNANVKDLYKAMDSDRAAAGNSMVHLTHASINGYFDPDLLAARTPVGYPGPYSAKQKLYRDTSRRLFATLVGLKRMYESSTLPTEKITFEEKFLRETSDKCTLHALVDQLSVYASNFQEQPWDDKLLTQANTELTGEGGVFSGIKYFEIVAQVVGKPYIDAKYKGFPLKVKIFDSKENGRSYRFYLVNESELGSTPIAIYNLKDPNKETFRARLDAAVGVRVAELLEGVTASRGDASGLKYDGQYWSGEVKMPAVPEYGIEALPSKVKVEFVENGTRVRIHSDKAKVPIYIDEMMSSRYRYGQLIVNKVLGMKEYNALNAFAAVGEIDFEDMPEEDGKFVLRFPQGLELEMQYAKDDKGKEKFTSVNPEQEKELVQSYEFREAYLRALDQKENGPFKVFDKFSELVGNFPEEYVMHLGKKLASIFTGGADIVPLEGASANVLTGSVADYYTNSVILAKKAMIMNAYGLQLKTCTSLNDINEKEKVIADRLNRVAAELKVVSKLALDKQGSDWTREEFVSNVIEPLKSAGLFSASYKFAVRRFENSIYNHLSLQASDLRKDHHSIAARLFDVYSYYTIGLDEASLDDDSYNEDIRYKEQYFLYVEQKVTEKALTFLKGGYTTFNIPAPISSQWEIKDYDNGNDSWKETEGTPAALDPIDEGGPYTHTLYEDKTDFTQFTELETELHKKYDEVLAYYTALPGINSQKMREYFDDVYMTGGAKPQFFVDADIIYKSAKRRSQQRDMISVCAQRLSDHLFQSEYVSAVDTGDKIARYLIEH